MAAAMIMNSNSLPVALLQTLAVSVAGLEWGQDDTIDSITGRALSYLLLCGTMGQFVSHFITDYLENSPRTNHRSAGVTVFTCSLEQFLQTRLNIQQGLTMNLAH